jgi:hypothetical protein
MERALVAVGYAIGAGLVLASRRGRIPRPRLWKWNTSLEQGGRVEWFRVQVEMNRSKKAGWRQV